MTSLLQRFAEKLVQHRLLGSHFLVLHGLQDGEKTMGECSQVSCTSKCNTTNVVDKLESLKLVKRCSPAADRRTILVRLTPQGEDLYQKLIQP